MTRLAGVCLACVLMCAPEGAFAGADPQAEAGRPGASWLDAPLRAWPAEGGVPRAAVVSGTASRSCLASPPPSREVDQIAAAGWRPFQLFDRPIGRGGVVVMGGLRDLTADCAPAAFQVFVFVDGAFAGALSPVEMTTGRDGVVGAIRVLPDDVVTAEFARYATGDSECCPSARVRVSYGIDRSGGRVRVVPTGRKSLRE